MTSGTTAPLQTSAPEFQYAALSSIVPSATNPRKTFDPTYIGELAASMREVGVIEPLIVRPIAGEQLEIVAGECRYRAAKIADIVLVPVRIRPYTDEQALEVQVIENLHRKDLHPLEEADGYRQLMAGGKHDAAWIASRVGLSVKYVYDRIRLLSLTTDAQIHFRAGRITAGHAILLARLTAADQGRALHKENGGVFTPERSLWDPAEDAAKGPRLHNGETVKAVSVRELQSWIDEHVRFDPKTAPDPMLFPDTALTLDTAREEAEKIIPITYENYIQPEAREGRTWGPRSWKRADGKAASKVCSFSAVGVISIGPGRGDAFRVCTNKEKCTTHWGAEIRARKRNASAAAKQSAKTGESAYDIQRRKDEVIRQREEAERARWRKAAPAILAAVAERIKKAPAGARGQLADIIVADVSQRFALKNAAEYVARGTSAEDLVRHAAFILLSNEVLDDWRGHREFPKTAKAFGIDVKKILDEAAPAGAGVVVLACKTCGCTEDAACEGGCAWAVKPDPKTGKGVCTSCTAKTRPPTTKKRAAAAARV